MMILAVVILSWVNTVISKDGLIQEILPPDQKLLDVKPSTRSLQASSDNALAFNEIDNFDSVTKQKDRYLQKVRGFFKAPESGEYKFYSSCSGPCEIYIGQEKLASPRKIISQKQESLHNEFNRYPDQVSHTIYLEKNNLYYIEGVEKQNAGLGHLSVGVVLPSDKQVFPITKKYLRTNKGDLNRKEEITRESDKDLTKQRDKMFKKLREINDYIKKLTDKATPIRGFAEKKIQSHARKFSTGSGQHNAENNINSNDKGVELLNSRESKDNELTSRMTKEKIIQKAEHIGDENRLIDQNQIKSSNDLLTSKEDEKQLEEKQPVSESTNGANSGETVVAVVENINPQVSAGSSSVDLNNEKEAAEMQSKEDESNAKIAEGEIIKQLNIATELSGKNENQENRLGPTRQDIKDMAFDNVVEQSKKITSNDLIDGASKSEQGKPGTNNIVLSNMEGQSEKITNNDLNDGANKFEQSKQGIKDIGFGKIVKQSKKISNNDLIDGVSTFEQSSKQGTKDIGFGKMVRQSKKISNNDLIDGASKFEQSSKQGTKDIRFGKMVKQSKKVSSNTEHDLYDSVSKSAQDKLGTEDIKSGNMIKQSKKISSNADYDLNDSVSKSLGGEPGTKDITLGNIAEQSKKLSSNVVHDLLNQNHVPQERLTSGVQNNVHHNLNGHHINEDESTLHAGPDILSGNSHNLKNVKNAQEQITENPNVMVEHKFAKLSQSGDNLERIEASSKYHSKYHSTANEDDDNDDVIQLTNYAKQEIASHGNLSENAIKNLVKTIKNKLLEDGFTKHRNVTSPDISISKNGVKGNESQIDSGQLGVYLNDGFRRGYSDGRKKGKLYLYDKVVSNLLKVLKNNMIQTDQDESQQSASSKDNIIESKNLDKSQQSQQSQQSQSPIRISKDNNLDSENQQRQRMLKSLYLLSTDIENFKQFLKEKEQETKSENEEKSASIDRDKTGENSLDITKITPTIEDGNSEEGTKKDQTNTVTEHYDTTNYEKAKMDKTMEDNYNNIIKTKYNELSSYSDLVPNESAMVSNFVSTQLNDVINKEAQPKALERGLQSLQDTHNTGMDGKSKYGWQTTEDSNNENKTSIRNSNSLSMVDKNKNIKTHETNKLGEMKMNSVQSKFKKIANEDTQKESSNKPLVAQRYMGLIAKVGGRPKIGAVHIETNGSPTNSSSIRPHQNENKETSYTGINDDKSISYTNTLAKTVEHLLGDITVPGLLTASAKNRETMQTEQGTFRSSADVTGDLRDEVLREAKEIASQDDVIKGITNMGSVTGSKKMIISKHEKKHFAKKGETSNKKRKTTMRNVKRKLWLRD